MAYFVYIVRGKDDSLYTGITWNLKRRIYEHNHGIKSWIRDFQRPVKLVYWEKLPDKIQAAKREKEIKGWKRQKKENLIKSLH